uniref:C-C motif chemokine 5-like isoform X1 n=1 Tax=Pogona vitticeps TaxID=103695 RepID=A0A6J0SNK9_9SAUR
MKISGTALPLFLLLLLLVASFALISNAADEDTKIQVEAVPGGREKCCLSYTSKPVPCHRLKSYFYVDGRCSLSAIIFVTRKDIKICANPWEPWVQECQRKLPSLDS